MTGAGNRKKGHSFERKIAQEMREIGYKNCKTTREITNGSFISDGGIDLQNTGKWAIQAKSWKNYCPMNTINEIKAAYGRIPLLLSKADGKEVLATMPWDDLKRIIFAILSHKNTLD